jgi:hypothetical protein
MDLLPIFTTWAGGKVPDDRVIYHQADSANET